MRDITRIPRMIKVIEDLWLRAPDMRFGQLIENLRDFSGYEDLFYLEDDSFEQLCKDFIDVYLKER